MCDRLALFFLIAIFFAFHTASAQSLPTGWSHTDIGSVGLAGSASYTNGVFTDSGSGTQIFGTADSFHFAYQLLSGDGTLVASDGRAGSSGRRLSLRGSGAGRNDP